MSATPLVALIVSAILIVASLVACPYLEHKPTLKEVTATRLIQSKLKR